MATIRSPPIPTAARRTLAARTSRTWPPVRQREIEPAEALLTGPAPTCPSIRARPAYTQMRMTSAEEEQGCQGRTTTANPGGGAMGEAPGVIVFHDHRGGRGKGRTKRC